MRKATQASSKGRRWSNGLIALLCFALVVSASQLRCALVDDGWQSDSGTTIPDGGYPDGGNSDGGAGFVCFPGTATTELQLFNHCTEAEQVDRPSSIPAKTWDGKSPLPYSN